MELSKICCRRSWYRSGPFNVGYIEALNGYLRVGPGRGKFYQDILQPGRKQNNMAGRSGIGVLVTGFSRVGALKKHAPLVFSSNPMTTIFFHSSCDVQKINTSQSIIVNLTMSYLDFIFHKLAKFTFIKLLCCIYEKKKARSRCP